MVHDSETPEEDGLLTGHPTRKQRPSRWRPWREAGLFLWAIVATLAVVVVSIMAHREITRLTAPPRPAGKRNLIMMVSDGMGPTSLSLTRSYRQHVENLPFGAALVLDSHLIGQSRTRSSSSLVTDSAAGATAFSCGKKSYNGAISVLPDFSPCGTVLEAAKRAGYMTGLVVTTRITDATPAVFASHVNMRSEEDRIAEQMIGQGPLGHVVDLMLGGGRCHFLPNSTAGSCRADGNDVIATAKRSGYRYAETRADFDKLKMGQAASFPLLGLFAPTDIPYEIDRRNQNDIFPSLDELARTALVALSAATKNSDKGFFLMIEGSRIDHAGHANDPAAQVHEVLAYDKAFASVIDFLEKDSTPGLMVATSDHETGGLAVARQLHETYPEYLWLPDALVNATASAEKLAVDYYSHRINKGAADLDAFVRKQVKEGLGILDASDAEISLLLDKPALVSWNFADMISRRAQTGWSTHGHSGENFPPFLTHAH
jgi:alkaline phosphatase